MKGIKQHNLTDVIYILVRCNISCQIAINLYREQQSCNAHTFHYLYDLLHANLKKKSKCSYTNDSFRKPLTSITFRFDL